MKVNCPSLRILFEKPASEKKKGDGGRQKKSTEEGLLVLTSVSCLFS